MITAILSKIDQVRSTNRGPDGGAWQRYGAPMTTNVATVIAAMDQERPGLSETKRNLLLYFCQGHYLDHSDTPLFAEPLYATPTGVSVEAGDEPVGDTSQSPLNTVSYVLSRYGNLSPADLRTLVQASNPWQLARKDDGENRVEWMWLSDWFGRPEEQEDPNDDRPTVSMSAAFRARYPMAGQTP